LPLDIEQGLIHLIGVLTGFVGKGESFKKGQMATSSFAQEVA